MRTLIHGCRLSVLRSIERKDYREKCESGVGVIEGRVVYNSTST